MIQFKEFLTETELGNMKSIIEEPNILKMALKTLKSVPSNYPILYRGFRYGRKAGIAFSIKSARDGKFKGGGGLGSESVTITDLLKALKVKDPVFCSPTTSQTTLFGTLFYVFPIGKSRAITNDDIHDMLVASNQINDVEEVAANYRNVAKSDGNTFQEVILDCKEYYLIHVQGLNDTLKKPRNFMAQSYKELAKLLEQAIAYYDRMKKRSFKESLTEAKEKYDNVFLVFRSKFKDFTAEDTYWIEDGQAEMVTDEMNYSEMKDHLSGYKEILNLKGEHEHVEDLLNKMIEKADNHYPILLPK